MSNAVAWAPRARGAAVYYFRDDESPAMKVRQWLLMSCSKQINRCSFKQELFPISLNEESNVGSTGLNCIFVTWQSPYSPHPPETPDMEPKTAHEIHQAGTRLGPAGGVGNAGTEVTEL